MLEKKKRNERVGYHANLTSSAERSHEEVVLSLIQEPHEQRVERLHAEGSYTHHVLR
jgi:hypothetical protein